MKINVIDKFDHQLILNKKSRFVGIVNDNPRTVIVDYVPTCENMLIDIVNRLQANLPEGVELHNAFLRETPRSYAEWFNEDNK